jgi:hypothetical protein
VKSAAPASAAPPSRIVAWLALFGTSAVIVNDCWTLSAFQTIRSKPATLFWPWR